MILKARKFVLPAIIFMGISVMAVQVFAASGASLFKPEGCIACHSINGVGGKVGPNLSHIGSQRSLSWLKTQIVTPGAHFASGSMVTINGKSFMAIMPNHKSMPASKVNALAEYLESLK
ncbi:MAG: c-type cytochrome [bacterium]